jgi:hypothetical protein
VPQIPGHTSIRHRKTSCNSTQSESIPAHAIRADVVTFWSHGVVMWLGPSTRSCLERVFSRSPLTDSNR